MHKETLGIGLRRLRAERGLSLSQLAQATGISSSFLSLVEQARSDITISRLLRLAEFYEVELADLLADGHAVPRANVHLLKAEPGRMIHSQEEGVDLFDLASGARSMLVPMLGIYQPGGRVAVNNVHEREAMVFVLDGTFELAFVGNPAVRLRRGEGAIYLSVAPYQVTNVGKGRGRILAIGLHLEQH